MTVYHTDGEEPVSTTVVRALEEVTGTPAVESPPLFAAVDPDALDALFRDRGTDGEVQFEHEGYRITATGSGEIRIEEKGDPTP